MADRLFEDVNFVIKHDANEYSAASFTRVLPRWVRAMCWCCATTRRSSTASGCTSRLCAQRVPRAEDPHRAISLLAEAVTDYSDDPEAVHRFGGRFKESTRLVHLVQEIIDLSQVRTTRASSPPPSLRYRTWWRRRSTGHGRTRNQEHHDERCTEPRPAGGRILRPIG